MERYGLSGILRSDSVPIPGISINLDLCWYQRIICGLHQACQYEIALISVLLIFQGEQYQLKRINGTLAQMLFDRVHAASILSCS